MEKTEVYLNDLIPSNFDSLLFDVLEHRHTHYVLKGGRGSSKSSFISIVIILLMMKEENKNVHAAIFRKQANTLRDSVFAQMQFAISALHADNEWTSTVSPMKITYNKTGQTIIFRGVDDNEKLKSLKAPFGYFGITWLEESNSFAGMNEIRSVLQTTMRGGTNYWVFKSFNPPPNRNNFMNREVLIQRKDQIIHHSTYLTVPKKWLGQQFIDEVEHLKNTNETAYRHEYLGEVVGSGLQIFENLNFRPITEEEIQGFDRIYYGVDWGWYPDPWQFVACYYHNKRLWIFDDLRRWRTSNEDTAKLLIDKGVMQDKRIDQRLTADSAEKKSCADYTRLGVKCLPAIKGAGSVEQGMKFLQGLEEIIIDPMRCPNVSKEFGEYEYEADRRTGEPIEGYPDINNHSIDSVRYATESIWRLTVDRQNS